MREVFQYFLRLGVLGFGGPLALIAQMQKDLVQERKWISEEKFQQVLPLIKMMPGPVAFQLATFIGHERRGFWGGFLAAIGLVLPSFFLMVALASGYDQFVQISSLKSMMIGMQAGAMALILLSLKPLILPHKSKSLFWILLVASVALLFKGLLPEVLLILTFGLLAVIWTLVKNRKLAIEGSTLQLFLICLKSGAVVFGTGLAIVPVLEGDFVDKLHWLTHSEFMDALAFGQLTPGPVVITVTFVGFRIAGVMGAIAATVGIFLPAFFHMTTWFPKAIGWLQKQKWIAEFSMGAIAAVTGAIVVTVLKSCLDWGFQLNLVLLGIVMINLLFKIPSWSAILIGSALGFLFF